jgi:hypothetical protein
MKIGRSTTLQALASKQFDQFEMTFVAELKI